MTLLSIISKKHDKGNLEEMFYLYYKDMLYTANDILNDIHAAEDVVQEAFIKIFNCFNKNVDIKCHETREFFVIVVRRLAIDLYRQRKRRSTVNIEDLDDMIPDHNSEDPEAYVLRLDNIKLIAAKLSEIREEYAQILALKYEYGYSSKELAEILDISEENVRKRLARAKKALHKIIGGEYNE
jgi:RNA polymerase sigma-70 factor, ECF subfamily